MSLATAGEPFLGCIRLRAEGSLLSLIRQLISSAQRGNIVSTRTGGIAYPAGCRVCVHFFVLPYMGSIFLSPGTHSNHFERWKEP